ncbi:hypothetical protein LXL04_026464 [Taraxacum kok-saghyz]
MLIMVIRHITLEATLVKRAACDSNATLIARQNEIEADDIGFPAKGGHRRRARASENSVFTSGTERWISHYEGDRPRGRGAVEVYSGEGSHKTRSHTAVICLLGIDFCAKGEISIYSRPVNTRISLTPLIYQNLRSLEVDERRWPLTNYMLLLPLALLCCCSLPISVVKGWICSPPPVVLSFSSLYFILPLKCFGWYNTEEDDRNGDENEVDIMRSLVKTSAVCGPHLQSSAAEEVDQMSAVCKKKTVCFLTSADCLNKLTFK